MANLSASRNAEGVPVSLSIMAISELVVPKSIPTIISSLFNVPSLILMLICAIVL